MASSKFTTTQGQAWDHASLARLSTEKLMGKVIPENESEADALLFSGNVDLVIPEVKPQAVVSLPPWKRM